jgi:hypothetical protein
MRKYLSRDPRTSGVGCNRPLRRIYHRLLAPPRTIYPTRTIVRSDTCHWAVRIGVHSQDVDVHDERVPQGEGDHRGREGHMDQQPALHEKLSDVMKIQIDLPLGERGQLL